MACLCQSKGNGARLIAKFLRGQIDKNPNAVPMSCWKIFSSEKPFIEGTIDKINADEKKKNHVLGMENCCPREVDIQFYHVKKCVLGMELFVLPRALREARCG